MSRVFPVPGEAYYMSGAGGPTTQAYPSGSTLATIDGTTYEADFVKVALNVVRAPGDDRNHLPEILRGWFGPDAGHPGTRHEVALKGSGKGWRLRGAKSSSS